MTVLCMILKSSLLLFQRAQDHQNQSPDAKVFVVFVCAIDRCSSRIHFRLFTHVEYGIMPWTFVLSAPLRDAASSPEVLPKGSPWWWTCVGVVASKVFINKRVGAMGDLSRSGHLGGGKDGEALRSGVPWVDGVVSVYGGVHQRRQDRKSVV